MPRDGASSDDVKTGGIRTGARPPDLHENPLSIWAILRANMQTSQIEKKTAIIPHRPTMAGSGKLKGTKSKIYIE